MSLLLKVWFIDQQHQFPQELVINVDSPSPGLLKQTLHFNKVPRCFLSILKSIKQGSIWLSPSTYERFLVHLPFLSPSTSPSLTRSFSLPLKRQRDRSVKLASYLTPFQNSSLNPLPALPHHSLFLFFFLFILKTFKHILIHLCPRFNNILPHLIHLPLPFLLSLTLSLLLQCFSLDDSQISISSFDLYCQNYRCLWNFLVVLGQHYIWFKPN